MSSVPVQTCTGCKESKPCEAFSVETRRRSGISARCRACKSAAYFANAEKVKAEVRDYQRRNAEAIRARKAAWYAENRELVKQRNAASYVKHRESRRKSAAAWREKNRAECAARTAAWRAADPERAREANRRFKQANKEKIAAWQARWHANNQEVVAEHHRRRKARLRSATIVPFTAAQLDARMAFFGYRCWMCKGPFEHVDHVKPIVANGPHMLANLRPSCAFCNTSKNGRWAGPQELQRFMSA